MKIGVASDTHRHLKNFALAVQYMHELGAQMIIHLGDDYTDCDEIGEDGIVRVPGVYSEQYQDPGIPNRHILELGGWQVLLSHTKEAHPNDLQHDPDPDSLVACKQVDAVLYGHTHIPHASMERGVLFINPGHLKDEDKRGNPPTFAMVELDAREAAVEIFCLKDRTPFKKEQYRR